MPIQPAIAFLVTGATSLRLSSSNVLVRGTGGYFSSTQATPDSIERLRPLVGDDLDYVPVQGVGNAVYWATVRDRSLAPERMGVLISQQGTDASRRIATNPP